MSLPRFAEEKRAFAERVQETGAHCEPSALLRRDRVLSARRAPSTCHGSDQLESRGLAVCIRNLVPTHAGDFGPDLESLAPASSVLGSSDVIAAEMEEDVDLIMG